MVQTWGTVISMVKTDMPPSTRLKRVSERAPAPAGGVDEGLECLLVDPLALVDVDGAPRVSLEAGIEEARRILQRRTLGEGQLYDLLVRLPGADQSRSEERR